MQAAAQAGTTFHPARNRRIAFRSLKLWRSPAALVAPGPKALYFPNNTG
jgi:hypothetical protein